MGGIIILIRGKVFRIILTLVVLLMLSATIFGLYVQYEKHRVSAAHAIDPEKGIASLERIQLNGIPQWISIRGTDTTNPILLYLHGGPGSSSLPLLRHFNSALENHFTVVTWDQRGAGKSYSASLSAEDMTMAHFVADTLKLTQFLIDRFPVERIYLCGHSWGTIIGMKAIQAAPHLFHAYAGIAQVVHTAEGEALSYSYTWASAIADDNPTAIAELAEIGPPPYPLDQDFWMKLTTQRRWLSHYGGSIFTGDNPVPPTLHLFAPEYNLKDFFIHKEANRFSVSMLWEELLAVDLIKQIPAVETPVYFFTGRHDRVAPAQLTKAYAHALAAPHSELVWFESSAHSPHFEEPDRFCLLLIEKFLSPAKQSDESY